MTRIGTVAPALSLCCAAALSCQVPGAERRPAEDVVVSTPSMTAIVKLPERFNGAGTYTMVVALHGSGGTAEGFAPVFASFAAESVVVAVPQAEFAMPGGGYSWFFLTSDRSLWESYDTRTVRDLEALIAEIRGRYPINRVIVFGFSQGASLAYMLGLLDPALVWGVVAVAGYLPEIDGEGSIVHAQDVTDARTVKLFIARGSSDGYVAREAFLSQRDLFLARGYSVTALEYVGNHYLTDELLRQVLRWLKTHL
jgi:phospholipase/carboxylesterase